VVLPVALLVVQVVVVLEVRTLLVLPELLTLAVVVVVVPIWVAARLLGTVALAAPVS
jgi:hypothetical protein